MENTRGGDGEERGHRRAGATCSVETVRLGPGPL